MKRVIKSKDLSLIGATERKGNKWIGRDIGACLGLADLGVSVVDDALPLFAEADAVIDFTSPKASVFHAELAAQQKCVLVIGTTGFRARDLKKITAAARHARIIRAGNMTLGINILTEIVKGLAGDLNDMWDIEISETHHRGKVDAPSGTALMLGDAVAKGRRVKLNSVAEYGRSENTGKRERGEIGFSSIRAGDVIGEHSITFATTGERLTFSHVATNRSVFVRGALKAARWGTTQPPGEYDMVDVLNLTRFATFKKKPRKPKKEEYENQE